MIDSSHACTILLQPLDLGSLHIYAPSTSANLLCPVAARRVLQDVCCPCPIAFKGNMADASGAAASSSGGAEDPTFLHLHVWQRTVTRELTAWMWQALATTRSRVAQHSASVVRRPMWGRDVKQAWWSAAQQTASDLSYGVPFGLGNL